jgi:hypothetical protein
MTNHQTIEFIRNEISHEFALLNGRVSWFASCQAFLIASFTLSIGNAAVHHAGWLAHYVLPVLGLLLCATVVPGILGAVKAIDLWLGRQHAFLQNPSVRAEMKAVFIDRFFEAPNEDLVHHRSLWFALSLPGVIAFFWVTVFILVRVFPLHHAG